jgi:hypothetical protein
MNIKDKLSPEDVIKRMEIPGHKNVYFVGKKGIRLTFLSQQYRALNLIWALNEVKKFNSQTRIIVVGAGLAGLTAAFAAYQLSAKVTLIESKSEPMHLQHGCRLRFIHPHILDWPKEGSDVSCTDLPCMNWGAGMADTVAKTVLDEWRMVTMNIKEQKFGYEVRKISIDPHTQSPRVFAEGNSDNFEQECDYLILAIGFGLEKTMTAVPFLSYWENDNFARPLITEPIPRRYLVTGCGDGGLIDAIRLRLQAFDHEKFVYMLVQEVEGLAGIKELLPQIDDDVARTLKEAPALGELAVQVDDAERTLGEKFDLVRTKKRLEINLQGRLLEEEYRKRILPEIPVGLTNLIIEHLRKDTIVFLNSPYESPLNLGSSILNRFLIFLLRLHGGLRYRAGEADIKPTADGQLFRVSFIQEQFQTEELEVHEVVIRHGPVSLIDRLFPKHIADACRAGAEDLNDSTRVPQYDEKFLAKPELTARKEAVVEEHKIRTNPLAAKKLIQADREYPKAVTKTPTDRKSVRADKEKKAPPVSRDDSADVTAYSEPFLIDEAYEPFKQTFPSKDAIPAPLTIGTAIQNIGQMPCSDDANLPSKGSGTLGCFVKLESGEHAVMTTASALGGRKAQLGDNICVVPDDSAPLAELKVIGAISRLRLPIPSSTRSSVAEGTVKFNPYEAALVTLKSDIEFSADVKQAHQDAPSFKLVFQPPSSADGEMNLIGGKVFKIGAKTGLTWGRIESVLTICTVRGEEDQYWYEGLFSISGLHNKPFSASGDGGALVVKKDGTVLGFIIAATEKITYACFIEPILEAFSCKLA